MTAKSSMMDDGLGPSDTLAYSPDTSYSGVCTFCLSNVIYNIDVTFPHMMSH